MVSVVCVGHIVLFASMTSVLKPRMRRAHQLNVHIVAQVRINNVQKPFVQLCERALLGFLFALRRH